jgi:filamentous hemagglutinin
VKIGFFHIMLRLLGCGLVLFPHYALAGSVNIPGFYGNTTLKAVGSTVIPVPITNNATLDPQGLDSSKGDHGIDSNSATGQVTIYQNQSNAIINWQSFNIGSDASVYFNQQGNSSWSALNRIWSADPSQIYGKLTADGNIFLINQNGILFGQGSQVNVNGLVASALNIKDNDFINSTLKFQAEDYQLTGSLDPEAAVSNYGTINANTGGSVFLIGPRVENAGVINASVGQVGLAAGTQVYLAADPNGGSALIVDVQETGAGEAWNHEGAQLTADEGLVGMYGSVVNQDGLIRSVTAVKQNGQIELRATSKITTGVNSVTESPISDSQETADSSFTFSGGQISMGGLQHISTNAVGVSVITAGTVPTIIEHNGVIDAPSGQVTMHASERVLLESGSSVNVGGLWSDEAASALSVEAQLNSVELTDAYGQKGGLLQGQTITTTVLAGSSIGDISGSILAQQKTALEKSINAGTIGITTDNGDIIVKQGASLDFSGGGIQYSGGMVDTTKLLSGTTIYDISNAPLTVQYDNIIGQYTKTYSQTDQNGNNITESYTGLYYGGATSLKTYVSSFTQGGNAGSVQLVAGTVVLDGQLNGSVTQGLYQTNRTLSSSYASTEDYQTALTLSEAQGLEMPTAGALTIDTTSKTDSTITVRSDTTPLAADFSSDPNTSSLAGQQTEISAKTLNAAALGSLTLLANAQITTDSDASISLSAGGAFTAQAGRIEHYGVITVPGGAINLKTVTGNVSTTNAAVNDEIYLGSGSCLDVSGEQVDNSLVGKIDGASLKSGQIQGGTISILDESSLGRGVFIQSGAVLDVSGGYQIDASGKITGGNAGTLEVRGSNIMLEGDIRGYALADSNGKISGGQIILQADSVDVLAVQPDWSAFTGPDSNIPDGLKGLVLSGDSFSQTGFTKIELDSVNNITIEAYAEVLPSFVKLKTPTPAVMQGQNAQVAAAEPYSEAVPGHDDLIQLTSDAGYETGPTAFTANAGKIYSWQDTVTNPPNNNATLTVSSGAVIVMAPEGKISLSGTGDVTMDGILAIRGGAISIQSGQALSIDGQILAMGDNRPDAKSTVPGFGSNYTAGDGGQVTLQASNGDLVLGQDSVIDISGSNAVENWVLADGEITSYHEAGNAGSLSITYSGNLTWLGSVYAQTNLAGTKGGTLSITSTDVNNGIAVKAEDMQRYVSAGFDDLTLRSLNSLNFSDAMDVTVGRQLTLDAPEIQGAGQDVTLQSPWITLTNTYYPASGTTAAGSGTLTLSSNGWIDLTGSITVNGFQSVYLDAARDIRLTDQYYTALPPSVSQGLLSTAADLTLKADRIYPTVLSDFTIQSTAGKVTILPADNPVGGPIYSAGGNLTVEAAQGIEVQGTLAAPMGTITLTTSVNGNPAADGSRIYLADGSQVTTAGSEMVNYGTIDINNDNAWNLTDKDTNVDNPMTVPTKSVTIDAPEVIMTSGATVDVSGGGSLFAYTWQAGIEGSVNPLTKTGRYVIMSDNSIQLPGAAVYIAGGAGLSAGVYSLLPIEDAFLPGAVVIEAQNLTIAAGQNLVTKSGYPIVAGYSTVVGTDIQSAQPTAYAVMPASDVLGQGNFTTKAQTEGDSGNVTIKGKTTIIDGRINAVALDGYQGGTISLSGAAVEVQSTTTPLPAGFDFTTSLDAYPDYQNKLIIAATSLSGQGFQEIDLGDATVTDSVTIHSGVDLEAPIISLTANKTITVESGAQLQAVVETGLGEINLNSPTGTAVIQAGATLHASHAINLNVGDSDVQGTLQVDHSALTLKGVDIYFVPDGYTKTGSGIYITDSLWAQYGLSQDITLEAIGYTDPLSNQYVSGEIRFSESFDVTAADNLTLDAARIVSNDGTSKVSVSAQTINFTNSLSASTAVPNAGGIGSFTASAGNITVGSGDVLFANFNEIKLNSQNDLTFRGQGSLTSGNADLTISAARVTTASTTQTVTNPDGTTSTPITTPDFVVYTGGNYYNDQNNLNPTHAIQIAYSSGGTQGTTSTPGGTLEFWGTSIDQGGLIQVDAGTIKLVATGTGPTDGIFLRSGSQILARGAADAPGGSVLLQTDSGSLIMEQGSRIDVSAGAQGDAGVVTMEAPVGGATINGDLAGSAQGGAGGSFVLDTLQLSDADMTGLIGTLSAGGFTESLDIRVRTGNIDILSGQTVKANHVILTADDTSNGQINVIGTIDASASPDAGIVELYANNDLNIGGQILAKGTSKGEEDVILSSANGAVNLQSTGLIDVSGNGTGQGVVYLRAQQQNGNDVKMNLNGAINGASAVYAEAFQPYDAVTTIDASSISAWQLDIQNFMANAPVVTTRLLTGLNGVSPDQFHLLPGIELRNSAGAITLDTNWDLTSWRDGGVPGVLTIRAAGDLTINGNLVDHPTDMSVLTASPVRDSWAFNLVAGADMSGSDYMSVNKSGTGDLNIADQKIVYTESAPIRFASGNDTLIGSGVSAGYMINSTLKYNLATYDGSIEGSVGGDLSIAGGAIQSATGDIDIAVNRDLMFSKGNGAYLGSIRTTGQAGPDANGNVNVKNYWYYTDGGNITLVVGGNVGQQMSTGWVTALDNNAWDQATAATSRNDATWSANYTAGTSGLATMGGGDLLVRTGGDFLTQAGTFGQNKTDNGDLVIYSGGDIRGRFLNNHGKAEIHALGNFGDAWDEPQIEAFDSRINVSAQGNIVLGAVVNPTIANPNVGAVDFWNLTYTEDASLSLKAGGDVTISGNSQFYTYGSDNSRAENERILPATVNIEAGGNIELMNSFALTPSSQGNLTLIAGGNISGSDPNNRAAIYVSDMDPQYTYTSCRSSTTCNPLGAVGSNFGNNLFDQYSVLHGTIYDPNSQTYVALHANDDTGPVVIQAGGDIMDLKLVLPKEAEITAGGDIKDIYYLGQNINPSDVSMIRAGGDITFSYLVTDAQTGLAQGGPGILLLDAGGQLDLGSSGGVQSIGDSNNSILGSQGSKLVIVSGYTIPDITSTAAEFFDTLRTEIKSGDSYDQSTQNAADIIAQTLGTPTGSGDINMTSSQISTLSGASDIYIISSGKLDVGKSSFFTNEADVQKTGIFTAQGGAINIFAIGDVNVNESRVMTFFGGDITIWSESGDINAGRGSTTEVNASPPQKVPVWSADKSKIIGYTTEFSAPAVGSGIRAVTYDPDGLAGPLQAPKPGDIYPHAIVIDAGEAGIQGGNIYVQAVTVLNSGNISSSLGSIVGMPQASQGATSLGTLAGSGSVAQSGQLSGDVSGMGVSRDQASQMVEDIIAKWLEVKVIDFADDDNVVQDGNKEE